MKARTFNKRGSLINMLANRVCVCVCVRESDRAKKVGHIVFQKFLQAFFQPLQALKKVASACLEKYAHSEKKEDFTFMKVLTRH